MVTWRPWMDGCLNFCCGGVSLIGLPLWWRGALPPPLWEEPCPKDFTVTGWTSTHFGGDLRTEEGYAQSGEAPAATANRRPSPTTLHPLILRRLVCIINYTLLFVASEIRGNAAPRIYRETWFQQLLSNASCVTWDWSQPPETSERTE